MLEHLPQCHSPHLSGISKDLPKYIYYITIISAEYLSSIINRSYIIQKDILLSQHTVVPNLLFDKFLTQIMARQGLFLSLARSNLLLSTFDESVVALCHITEKPLTTYMTNLRHPRLHLTFTLSLTNPSPHHIWLQTLLCMSSLLWIQPLHPPLTLIFPPTTIPSTTPLLPLNNLHLLHGIPCPTTNSPWNQPSNNSHENIVMSVNGLFTLRKPAGKNVLVPSPQLCQQIHQ